MTRLLLLLTLACTTAFAAEPTLVVPPLSKPSANSAEGDPLQARYDAAWTRFEEAVGKATAEVTKALDSQFDKAADAGNLELADMWDKKKKFFLDTKTLEWAVDGKAKVEWRKTNPKVDFPDEFSEVVVSAQQAYVAAVDALQGDYEALVKEYTKARNLDRAKHVREEMAVLDTKSVASPQRPRMVEEKPAAKRDAPNLLRLVDLKRDVVRGEWKRDGDDLISNSEQGRYATVIIRIKPPAEYDYEVTFTPLGGQHTVTLNCGTNVGTGFGCCFGGWGNKVTGLFMLGGADADSNRTTVRQEAWLSTNNRHTAVVSVRKREVSVSLNDRVVIRMPTDYRDLRYRDDVAIPADAFGVSSWVTPTRFHRIEVRPIGDSATKR